CASSMVATSQPLAAIAGLDVLGNGGNAVDAALAAAMALAVVEPCSNGIGSDAFAVVHHDGALHGLNASGRCPAAWTPGHFSRYDGMPTLGWDSVTVPGAVSGWVALADRFGTMPLTNLVEHAARHARDGYQVSPQAAASWKRSADRFKDFPAWQSTFAPDGRTPGAGERFTCPDQARTLEEIASTNGASFYEGDLADGILRASRSENGLLEAEDLASHRAEWVDVLGMDYRERRLHELPPNGQGIVALVAAGILDRHDASRLEPDDPLLLHLQIESMKHAFATCKPELGCPGTMDCNVDSLLEGSSLDALADLIDPAQAHDPGHVVVTDASTVYLAVADANGMMVSFIQSNYMGFGSGVVIPGTGIAMQNRGACFIQDPGHPNEVRGGRRPYHTIIPGFITREGVAETAFGVMGGHMQPQGHLQVLSRMVDHGQNPQAALDAPRWRIDRGRRVHLEPGFAESTIQGLRDRGHEIELADACSVQFGGGQVIRRVAGGYVGGSDSRRDGLAIGR
ncbi:MAG: gamma-glutamyltransferase, partial [Phycisphaerae bacterium]|nr:gamma-glutamyltransferase [Phycisphaerae bacterium]